MNRFIQTMFRRMSENITSFWVIEDLPREVSKTYPDYPVTPFGPARLISKETIDALVNPIVNGKLK